MKRRTLVATGLGVYALALLAWAPAALVDGMLDRASGSRLRVAEAEGTLWSGSGQLEFRAEDGRALASRHVAWQLRSRALAGLRLAYRVELDRGPQPFPVTISWSRIELADVDLSLPAAALAAGLPKLAPLGLSGEVTMQVPQLSIQRDAVQGSASFQWRSASSALTPVSPLGDYELHLQQDGSTVQARLRTLQGPLQLAGQGDWLAGNRPVFLATAQMPAELRPRLAPFLRLVAVERGDGSFGWQLK